MLYVVTAVDYTAESFNARFQLIQYRIHDTASPKNPSKISSPVALAQVRFKSNPTQNPIHIGQLEKYPTIGWTFSAKVRTEVKTFEWVIAKLIPKQTNAQVRNS